MNHLVFINKTDRAGADVPKVLLQLAEHMHKGIDMEQSKEDLPEELAAPDDVLP